MEYKARSHASDALFRKRCRNERNRTITVKPRHFFGCTWMHFTTCPPNQRLILSDVRDRAKPLVRVYRTDLGDNLIGHAIGRAARSRCTVRAVPGGAAGARAAGDHALVDPRRAAGTLSACLTPLLAAAAAAAAAAACCWPPPLPPPPPRPRRAGRGSPVTSWPPTPFLSSPSLPPPSGEIPRKTTDLVSVSKAAN